jgi:deoxyribonuclease IV
MSARRAQAKIALPVIGAQLSTAGGFAPVPQRALDVGAEVVQIFNTNPRIWRARVPAPGEMETFVAGLRAHKLRLFVHSVYLINLASPDDALRRRSAAALADALATGALAGAEGVVTHIGSHRGTDVDEAAKRVVGSIAVAVALAEGSLAAGTTAGTAAGTGAATGAGTEAAAAASPPAGTPGSGRPPLPALLLETGTGAGNTLGGRLEELVVLLSLEEAVGLAARLPLGVCIDTAHLFAAGYAVHEDTGLEDFVHRLRTLGLLERIGLVHLNDSKIPFAVRRDQHENLGEGFIGYDGLARVVRHPALAHAPFILEVPGADGHGPDAANMALAKRMRSGLGAPRRRVRSRGAGSSATLPAAAPAVSAKPG